MTVIWLYSSCITIFMSANSYEILCLYICKANYKALHRDLTLICHDCLWINHPRFPAGSFAVHIWNYLWFGIIFSPIWESFLVWGSFAVQLFSQHFLHFVSGLQLVLTTLKFLLWLHVRQPDNFFRILRVWQWDFLYTVKHLKPECFLD